MKKRYVIILVLGFFVLSLTLGGFIGVSLMKSYNKEDNKTESVKKIKSSRTLSMMLETGFNTGVYEQTTRSTWPTEGYLFNEELSKCENGGKLSWNDENSTVVMTGSTSDKCYVYFDKAVYLADYIKSQYTGTQGENGIYLHNSSLENGAADNSYRYAGGDYVLTSKATNVGLTTVTTLSSEETTGVVNFYCDGTKQYVGYPCSNLSNTHYYTLQYDSSNTQYESYSAALAKALTDEYLTKDNVKNFVCFGSDSATCPNDNLYRIIGVFGDQVKLIKADYTTNGLLGSLSSGFAENHFIDNAYDYLYMGNLTMTNLYYWNNARNNTWSESRLNTRGLNGTYLTNLGTTWANKIAETTWKVGGNAFTNIGDVSVPNAYQNEIVSPAESTTHSAKIGLMYASDYGYAARPIFWANNYGLSDDVVYHNWMGAGIAEWTITRISGSSLVIILNRKGQLGSSDANSALSLRPVFYLNSNVTYSSGDGSSNNPIRVN